MEPETTTPEGVEETPVVEEGMEAPVETPEEAPTEEQAM
jgi:hypothetical protein